MPGEALNVLVLGGGPDAEREVSLRSSAAVAQALRDAGHTVQTGDILPDDPSSLDLPCDVVFPVLHGKFGEGGPLQHLLESRGLTYVGSGPKAAECAMDKVASKQVSQKHGVPTPAWQLLTVGSTLKLALPLVLKPIHEGSSVGVHICKSAADGAAAQKDLESRFPNFMAEAFIQGRELTVGIVGDETLPPIQIVPATESYDYQAKYFRNDTQYRFDIDLPAATLNLIRRYALTVHQKMGCRHLSRVDFLVDARGEPWFLEINTMPGFTDHSLLPMAARRAGLEMPALCDRLVRMALAA